LACPHYTSGGAFYRHDRALYECPPFARTPLPAVGHYRPRWPARTVPAPKRGSSIALERARMRAICPWALAIFRGVIIF
jgi:hypothetical protein